MDDIITNIIANFDWAYMLSVNVLTYSIIKLVDYLNKDKEVSVLVKRLILILSIALLGGAYMLFGDVSKRVLLNSAVLAPVAWDFVFKPIFKKLGINYKSNDTLPVEEDDSDN